MPEYPFFPMFVDLSRRRVLVVGGGRIAARRVNTLVQFCPEITVVAPVLHPEIAALAWEGRVRVAQRPYRETDLEDADMVLACTDDAALNDAIALACRDRRIPVNAASDRRACDFHFPGVARRDRLVIGVNAGGEDHALARRTTGALRNWLEQYYDPADGGNQ